MRVTIVWSHMPFMMLRYFSPTLGFPAFYHEGMLHFAAGILESIERIVQFLLLNLFIS